MKNNNNNIKNTVQIFQSRDGYWLAADEKGTPLNHYDYQTLDTLAQAMAWARKCGLIPKRNTQFDRSL